MHIRLLLFLSAFLVLLNGAMADPPSNTTGVPSSASLLIQQIARDIEAIRPKFTELADFSSSRNSDTRIEYRRNADYVAKDPKRNSYYDVKPGGCLITVDAWDASGIGWPGMNGGPDSVNIDQKLPNGIRILASIKTQNKELQKALSAAIDTHLRTAK